MKARDEVVTGVFVLLGVALIVVGALWLSEHRWGGEYRTLEARFDGVGQLRAGNTVRLRGVDVGSVQSIDVGADAVTVTLRIRSEVPLPERFVVSAQPVSLFGEWSAAIAPASRYPEAAARAASLPEGTVPGVTSSDFAQLSDYTGQIASNLENITEQLEVAFNEQTARNLARAVDNFEQASEELVGLLARQRQSFGGFAEDMEESGRTLRRVAAGLDSTVGRLERATAGGELEAILDNTRRTTASLERVSGRLEGTAASADRTIQRADSALRHARAVLARVDTGQGSLARMTRDPRLYEDLTLTLTELQALLADLKQNPGKYFKFSIF